MEGGRALSLIYGTRWGRVTRLRTSFSGLVVVVAALDLVDARQLLDFQA
jgi:hypothetical protein